MVEEIKTMSSDTMLWSRKASSYSRKYIQDIIYPGLREQVRTQQSNTSNESTNKPPNSFIPQERGNKVWNTQPSWLNWTGTSNNTHMLTIQDASITRHRIQRVNVL